MATADTVRLFLEQSGVQYSVIPTPYTQSGRESAEVTHIPQGHLAKAVVLIDDVGYLMAGSRAIGTCVRRP
jgi:prolyl-tRNA editing enzyme YbaK/EbsC (Cys-tRNA(Pro) deacylase)